MVDRFDIVSVGVKNECRVVAVTVLRTQSRRSVVLRTCAQGGAIERVDLLPALGCERYVEMRGLFVRLVQAQ